MSIILLETQEKENFLLWEKNSVVEDLRSPREMMWSVLEINNRKAFYKQKDLFLSFILAFAPSFAGSNSIVPSDDF